jgi:hypothetical protein
VAAELVVAVRPDREVARAVAEDRVGPEPFAQCGHDGRHLQRAGELDDLVQVALVLRVGRVEQPLARGRRRELRRRGRERLEIAGDAELRLVDGPQQARVGMHVDQPLHRRRRLQEGVGVGRDLAQAPADRQQHVGVADPRRERRVHAEPRVPRVGGRVVVDVVLAAEGGGDGDALRLAERCDVEAGP